MTAFKMTSDGDSWMGTFALTVAFAAADLLSDGRPVGDVAVVTRSGGTIRGTLTAVEGGHLIVDGRRIEIADDVVGFAVH